VISGELWIMEAIIETNLFKDAAKDVEKKHFFDEHCPHLLIKH
jgi:hypothetical protein